MEQFSILIGVSKNYQTQINPTLFQQIFSSYHLEAELLGPVLLPHQGLDPDRIVINNNINSSNNNYQIIH